MTPDELANQFKADFDALHAMIEANPDERQRANFEKAAKVFHKHGDHLLKLVKSEKHPHGNPIIQPFSGGEPKPKS